MSEENISIDQVEKVKPSWFWIKNTQGEASATITFLTVAFIVTTASYVLSMFENIGTVSLRPFDSAACSAYLIPLLTAYLGRRWTDAKFSENK